MTQISASMVKELREKTGAGMMDCKDALSKAGDIDSAIKLLREKGLARAAKKTSRIAAEGLVAIEVKGKTAVMVELNCETDFVARNDDFNRLLADLAKTALGFDVSSCRNQAEIEGALLNSYSTAAGKNVEEYIKESIATIGEKIDLRRFCVLNEGQAYGSYLHGAGSIGALVEFQLTDPYAASNPEFERAARDVAMHVTAANPSFINEGEISPEWEKAEREIFRAQILAQGKPEAMVDKIVDGKMSKHKKDYCLLDQPFVKNPDESVGAMLERVGQAIGAQIKITKMVRFKVGEGIEKKAEDFASEVKKMTA